MKNSEYLKKEVKVAGHNIVVSLKKLRPVGKNPNLLNPTPDDFVFDIVIYVKSSSETFSGRVWNGSLITEGYVNNWAGQIFEEIKPMLTQVMVSVLKNCYQFQLFDQVYEKNKSGKKLTERDIKEISNKIIDKMIRDFSLDEVVFKSVYAPFSVVVCQPLYEKYAVDYNNGE